MSQTLSRPPTCARLHGKGEFRHTANSLPTGRGSARAYANNYCDANLSNSNKR